MKDEGKKKAGGREPSPEPGQSPVPGKRPASANVPLLGDARCHPGNEGQDPDCWLEEWQRSRLMHEVNMRVERANTAFCEVLLRREIMERMSPDPNWMTIVLEVGFAAAGVGIGKAVSLLEDMRIAGDSVINPDLFAGSMDVLTKMGERKAEDLAGAITPETNMEDFLASLRDQLRNEAQDLAARANQSTDSELVAMAIYWDQEFHSQKRYEKELEQLLSSYQQDVEELGYERVAVDVRGPSVYPFDRRVAICRRRENVLGNDPKQLFEFLHWASDDVAHLSAAKQAQSEQGSISLNWNDSAFVWHSRQQMQNTGSALVSASEAPEVSKWLDRHSSRQDPLWLGDN